MADKQPENGDRFERFGSDRFRCSTLHTVAQYRLLATKRAVIHGCCNVQAAQCTGSSLASFLASKLYTYSAICLRELNRLAAI